jgi:lipopolysaccharide export system protein LptC
LAIIILFCALFLISIWLFATREDKPIIAETQSMILKKSFVMDQFKLSRYKGKTLVGEITAEGGQFVEPNVLHLWGDVRAKRLINGDFETVSSDFAEAYFASDSLSGMLNGAELVTAELNDEVKVSYKGHRLYTDFAKYLPNQELIVSERPVLIDGPNRSMTSDKGFQIDLVKQNVDVFGEVKGVFRLDDHR